MESGGWTKRLVKGLRKQILPMEERIRVSPLENRPLHEQNRVCMRQNKVFQRQNRPLQKENRPLHLKNRAKHLDFSPQHLKFSPQHLVLRAKHFVLVPQHFVLRAKHLVLMPLHLLLEAQHLVLAPKHLIFNAVHLLLTALHLGLVTVQLVLGAVDWRCGQSRDERRESGAFGLLTSRSWFLLGIGRKKSQKAQKTESGKMEEAEGGIWNSGNQEGAGAFLRSSRDERRGGEGVSN